MTNPELDTSKLPKSEEEMIANMPWTEITEVGGEDVIVQGVKQVIIGNMLHDNEGVSRSYDNESGKMYVGFYDTEGKRYSFIFEKTTLLSVDQINESINVVLEILNLFNTNYTAQKAYPVAEELRDRLVSFSRHGEMLEFGREIKEIGLIEKSLSEFMTSYPQKMKEALLKIKELGIYAFNEHPNGNHYTENQIKWCDRQIEINNQKS